MKQRKGGPVVLVLGGVLAGLAGIFFLTRKKPPAPGAPQLEVTGEPTIT